MFTLKLDIKNAIKDIADFITGAEKTAKETFGETAGQITEDMREPGKPITYPVQWDSEKQRRAFFATNGFGAGIPYKRTGAYVAGWTKTELPNGWQVSNQHPAGAIGGTLQGKPSLLAQGGSALSTWQSRIHRGRWKSFLVVATQRVSEMPKRFIERLRIKTK